MACRNSTSVRTVLYRFQFEQSARIHAEVDSTSGRNPLESGDNQPQKSHPMIPVILAVVALIAADAPADEGISVTVVGILRTGIVAIGGETTGTTITAKGVTLELDLGKNADLRQIVKKLDGKKVTVRGTLERRPSVEVKERWIVTVTELQAVGDE